MIKIKSATAGYFSKKEKIDIISEISISAKVGELIALIGINGSGKSTLLRSIAGLHKLLSGNIFIDNKKQSEYDKISFAKKTAFVSSEIINSKYLKVKDVVALGRFPHQKISGRLTEKDNKIITEAFETVGITHLKEKYINEISDGERQKVMTARALAQKTDIILLDEPAAFLDLANKFSLYKILSDTAQKLEKTIIFSTHDLNIALKYCDKVWLIKNKTIYEGAPEDLFLSDLLPNIFSDKNVIFNSDTFEFSVRNDKITPVNIVCNKNLTTVKEAVINALKRKGFYPVNKEADIKIEIKNPGDYKIFTDDYTFNANNIYNLAKIIKSI